jgi:hypothetical protein
MSGATALHRAPVTVTTATGREGGLGEVEFARPGLGHRLARAVVLFLVGLGGGLLLLPVPLIHLFGIFFFLGMTALATNRLLTRQVLRGASGTCPACGVEGRFFVGLGGRRLRFPIKTHCKECHVSLHLMPLPSTGGRG